MTRRVEPSCGEPVVERCKAGDCEAFRELYRRHSLKLYRFCASSLGDPVEAEDAVQAVFTVAFRRIDEFDGSRPFSSWLYGIAIRVLANLRRSIWRRRRLISQYIDQRSRDRHGTLDPERHAAARQSFARMQSALGKLSDKNRTAFLLYHGRGMTIQEVADATGVALQTTANRIQAARRQLLRIMSLEHTECEP